MPRHIFHLPYPSPLVHLLCNRQGYLFLSLKWKLYLNSELEIFAVCLHASLNAVANKHEKRRLENSNSRLEDLDRCVTKHGSSTS